MAKARPVGADGQKGFKSARALRSASFGRAFCLLDPTESPAFASALPFLFPTLPSCAEGPALTATARSITIRRSAQSWC